MREQLTVEERLVACALVRTRFAGRAKLEREATCDLVALAQLEVRLGLATAVDVEAARNEQATLDLRATIVVQSSRGEVHHRDAAEAFGYLLAGDDYAARTRMAVRRYATRVETYVSRRVARAACATVDALRANRAKLRTVVDPLAKRQPRAVEWIITARRAKELVAAAGFREATHRHSTTVQVCDRGSESASSSTDRARPADVGLGKSYQNAAFWVTTSSHTWHVSAAILSPEVRALNASAPRGVVYLRPDLRVVQGRGTALKVERRGPKGGWS